MTRVNPSPQTPRPADHGWTLIDKWLNTPTILCTFLVAFLATLTALILIAGTIGYALALALAPLAHRKWLQQTNNPTDTNP